MNLDGLTMYVSSTSSQGVVNTDTRLHFVQKGAKVFARYRGGKIERGYLIGRLSGSRLKFRYLQVEESREIHGGSSICEVLTLSDGRIRILEHFAWRTREGNGTNVFDQCQESQAETPHP